MRKPKRMLRNLAVFYLFLVPLCGVSADDASTIGNAVVDPIEEDDLESPIIKNPMEDAIQKFTAKAQDIKATSTGFYSNQDNTELLRDLEDQLDHIMKLMKEQTNVYKFIEARGMDRVILPYLHDTQTELRSQLLKLTQLLFDVAPTTTSVMIPIGVLDILLEIFEEEDSLQLKARTMYILYAWLPDNPKVQARLMKIKGLDIFYQQVHKLDANIIETQLKLFSKIIKEHIKARSDGQKVEPSKINYYKNIGLIERLSTARICHGLFDIFQLIWEYDEKNKAFMVPVFEILIDVQPYCTDTLLGRIKTLNFLTEVHEFVKETDDSAKEFYEQLGVNTTDLSTVLHKYVDKLQPRDEL